MEDSAEPSNGNSQYLFGHIFNKGIQAGKEESWKLFSSRTSIPTKQPSHPRKLIFIYKNIPCRFYNQHIRLNARGCHPT